METIHAILGQCYQYDFWYFSSIDIPEEGAIEMEEEISISDDPPDYEPPPEYSDVIHYIRKVTSGGLHKQKYRGIMVLRDIESRMLQIPYKILSEDMYHDESSRRRWCGGKHQSELSDDAH